MNKKIAQQVAREIFNEVISPVEIWSGRGLCFDVEKGEVRIIYNDKNYIINGSKLISAIALVLEEEYA